MIILAIPVPFQQRIIGITGQSLIHPLADPQPAPGGVESAFLFRQTAYPAGSWIIIAMSTEYEMNLIYEVQRELFVLFITSLKIQSQEVADCKGICPQVALWLGTVR